MATPDGAMAAGRIAYGGREDSLEATWELAEIEERRGDSLFFGGEPLSLVGAVLDLPHASARPYARMSFTTLP